MTNLDPSAPPIEYPDKSEDEWLVSMRSWTDDELRGMVTSNTAPNAAKGAARQRMQMVSGAVDRSGKPMNGPAFDRITNRTLGKPREDPKVVIQQRILNIGTEHIFDSIDAYLSEESSREDFRLGAQPLLAGPNNGASDPEEPPRERSGPSGTSEGG